jgi:hypothetical protein
MALAAEADDGDLLVLDEIKIGIPVIINAHGPCPSKGPKFGPVSIRFRASRAITPFCLP